MATQRLDAAQVDRLPLPPDERGRCAGFVEHERIPVLYFPYEWTFGMLRDAALLQLELVEAAIREDMTLKDGGPVFIDIPSFEMLPVGAPWAGYRQFCELFLFPLMLQA